MLKQTVPSIMRGYDGTMREVQSVVDKSVGHSNMFATDVHDRHENGTTSAIANLKEQGEEMTRVEVFIYSDGEKVLHDYGAMGTRLESLRDAALEEKSEEIEGEEDLSSQVSLA